MLSLVAEPNFIYMDHIPESENSPDGDDDKIYLFFSETAVEYDFYHKLAVSRVARVCKVLHAAKERQMAYLKSTLLKHCFLVHIFSHVDSMASLRQ